MENGTGDILRLENTLPPNPVAIAPSKSGLPSLAILSFRIEAPLGKVTIFALHIIPGVVEERVLQHDYGRVPLRQIWRAATGTLGN